MSEETKAPQDETTDFEKQLQIHRDKLQTGESDNQREYDKAVIALSGGALGISIGLLKDVFARDAVTGTGFLLTAWILWTISLTATLYSFYFSAKAFREELKRLDDSTIYLPNRNWWTTLTEYFNAASGILFIVGIVSIICFLVRNPLSPPALAPLPSGTQSQQTSTPKTP